MAHALDPATRHSPPNPPHVRGCPPLASVECGAARCGGAAGGLQPGGARTEGTNGCRNGEWRPTGAGDGRDGACAWHGAGQGNWGVGARGEAGWLVHCPRGWMRMGPPKGILPGSVWGAQPSVHRTPHLGMWMLWFLPGSVLLALGARMRFAQNARPMLRGSCTAVGSGVYAPPHSPTVTPGGRHGHRARAYHPLTWNSRSGW